MVDVVEVVRELVAERAEVYCDREPSGAGECGVGYCPMWAGDECQVDAVLELMRLGEQAKESSDEVLDAIKEAFPDTAVGIMRNVTWTKDRHQEDAPDTFNEMVDPFKEDPNASD